MYDRDNDDNWNDWDDDRIVFRAGTDNTQWLMLWIWTSTPNEKLTVNWWDIDVRADTPRVRVTDTWESNKYIELRYEWGWWRLYTDGSNIYTNRMFRADGWLRFNSWNELDDVTWNYGSVQINWWWVGWREGFSIDWRSVFMHNWGDITWIYNDVDNKWFLYWIRNWALRLFNNWTEKLRTDTWWVIIQWAIDNVTCIWNCF